MTITDSGIHRLESIYDEINKLLDEAETIIGETDDYVIRNKAESCWISTMRFALKTNNKVVTMQETIDSLWKEWHRRIIL